MRREKKNVSPQSRSLFSASFDCSRVLEYVKIRTVLQSRPRRTLDSLKSVFNVFRRKLSLGAPNGFGGLSLEQDIFEVLVSEQSWNL